MTESRQGGNPQDARAEQSALKRKLAWRVGFAGAMIVALLATLALFDYLNTPDEAAPGEPHFTEPVPVPKKDVTQPVKPAEPPAEEKPPAVAPPESSAVPVDKSLPPGPPEVAAQPVLPRGATRVEREKPAAAHPAPPAHAALPAQPAPGAAAPPRTEREAPPAPGRVEEAAPARLISGYALQAGVFSDVRRAEELHARLTLNGIPSTIEARVQVGPFRTRAEAEAARARMKALGVDAVLLPPRGGGR